MRRVVVGVVLCAMSQSCGPARDSDTAREAGASEVTSLRLYGNEPFWNVEISAGERIDYTRMGEAKVEFPYVAPTSPADSVPTFVYGPVTDSSGFHEIRIRVEQRPCPDTMADIIHPMHAEVIVDGEELSGCARHLDDVPEERP